MTQIDDLVDEAAARAVEYDIAMGQAAQRSAEAITRGQLDAADKLPGKPKANRQDSQWIAARIDGREQRLQIVPEDLPAFEAANGSAHAALRQLIAGTWTVDLVRRVIAFSAFPATDRERTAKLARWVGSMGVNGMAIPVPAWLDDLLSTKPPAPLASLAALILTAALFGIPDDEARWSDEADGAV